MRKKKPPSEDALEAGRLRLFEVNKLLLEQNLDHAGQGQKFVIDFALMALRTLSIVNGGALIAMLTFIGNYPALIKLDSPIWWSFIVFGCGLAYTMACMLYSYLAQGLNSNAAQRGANRTYLDAVASGQLGRNMEWVAQIGAESSKIEREENRERSMGGIWQHHAVAAGICGFCAFCSGLGLAVATLLQAS